MAGSKLQALAERAVGAFLGRNERSVARVHPVPAGPLDPRRLPWTAALHDRTPELRDELRVLMSGASLPEVNDLAGSDQGARGEWTTFVAFAGGRWVEGNADRAPRLVAAVRDVPRLRTAGYTVLAPGAHIPEHRGPTRSLRYQVGMLMPPEVGAAVTTVGGQPHVWHEGAELLFDDGTLHEARNDGSVRRYVLFVEVGWELSGRAALMDDLVRRLMDKLSAGFVQRAERHAASAA